MTSSSSTAGKLIKTRLCLISDTHSTSTFPADDPDHPYRRPLPSADILIHSGDLTSAGQIDEYQVTVQDLKDADAELKLVIAGNHDLSLDTAFYAEVGFNFHCRGSVVDVAAVREMWTGKEARDAGIVYLDEGVHRFTLKNGACFTVRCRLLPKPSAALSMPTSHPLGS
jgi:predicted MPP superfamily phosphohydrolase